MRKLDADVLCHLDECNQRIRKIIIRTGEVSTLAGRGFHGPGIDGVGTEATFDERMCVAFSSPENALYIGSDKRLRRLDLNTHEVTTIKLDGNFEPNRIAVASDGTLIIVAYQSLELYAVQPTAGRRIKLVAFSQYSRNTISYAYIAVDEVGGRVFASDDYNSSLFAYALPDV